MKSYISTSVYRKYLSLLATSGIKLSDLMMLNLDGKSTEFPMVHCASLENYPPQEGKAIGPMLTITSWPIIPTDTFKIDSTLIKTIDAEEDWHATGNFWFGKLEKMYKDLFPGGDKKLTGFGWCGNNERELAFPQLNIFGDAPMSVLSIPTSKLELLHTPQIKNIGAVDLDGNFTPASGVVTGSVPISNM